MKSVLRKYAVASACVLLTACGGSGETVSGLTSSTKLAAVRMLENGAVFSGERANYTVVRSASGYTVIDNAGADGTTNLNGSTPRLQFTDVTVNTTTAVQAQQIAADDLKILIELYVAFFNRVPEADGLAYWIGRFKAGQSIGQISEDFYAAAIQYSSLTGYAVSMTPSEFVRVIYKNVLGRSGNTAPPEGDVQFWAGRIASGAATKGTLIRSMLDSAHSFKNDPTWGWVPALLDNKYTVGRYFAVEQGLNYNTAELSIQRTMEIAATVTPQGFENAINRIPVAMEEPPLAGQASFSSALLNAPADNAGLSGSFRLEVRGTGIENVELLPPSGYTPVIARFNISADKTFAWLDVDTTTMPNGTMVSRIVAFSMPPGQGGSETTVMPARTWNLYNNPQPGLIGPIPPASFRPQVILQVSDLPYVDPQPLVTMMRLDDASYRQMLLSDPARVRRTMQTYIPAHVSLFPVSLGFSGEWYACVDQMNYIACRDSMTAMIAIMNSRAR